MVYHYEYTAYSSNRNVLIILQAFNVDDAGARISKRFELHDRDMPSRSIKNNPNSNPNANPNHGRGSWNQSPLSECDLSGNWMTRRVWPGGRMTDLDQC